MSPDFALGIRPTLPAGGLEELLDRPWVPVVNAILYRDEKPSSPSTFPLACVVQAPNSRGFLSTLGRPLAIARDLESEPGIWWLSSADERYDFVVFSDAHRKSAWKGGQLCVATRSLSFTENHASMKALCLGFEQLWGVPPARDDQWFWDPEWFDERLPALGDRRWPVFPQVRPKVSRKP